MRPHENCVEERGFVGASALAEAAEAILAAIGSQRNRSWTVTEMAEQLHLSAADVGFAVSRLAYHDDSARPPALLAWRGGVRFDPDAHLFGGEPLQYDADSRFSRRTAADRDPYGAAAVNDLASAMERGHSD